jgi:hypothetical protein
MSRYCKIVVLPEDAEHANLARGYFKARDVDSKYYTLRTHWTGSNGNNAAVRRWFCEEISLQVSRLGSRQSILALIDEDGQGLEARRNEVRNDLKSRGLPDINPSEGRCLVLPMRNVETWMVWAARWQAAGCPASPTAPSGCLPVSELNDYKRRKTPDGNPLPEEPLQNAYKTGKAIASLDPAAPPSGLPPALQAVLQPLSEFLRCAKL